MNAMNQSENPHTRATGKVLSAILHVMRSAARRGKYQLAFWERTPWHWRSGQEEELDHWSQAVKDMAGKAGGRLDPNTELDGDLKEIIAEVGAKARILDVGAGPLTVLGKCWDGQRLDITASDPLADQYDSLLDKSGITPVIRTVKCDGEHLVEKFGPNQFDMVHAKNSVDHSYNALQVVMQMVAVTKPGGMVVLQHMRNEAEYEHYAGMHRWNLDLQDGRFVIWDHEKKIDVAAAIEPGAQVIQACPLPPTRYGGEIEDRWFRVVIRKARE